MTNKPIYFWHELSEDFQKKLMSDKFVQMDCLDDGNCEFRTIETALKHAGYKISPKKLKTAVSKYIYHLSNQDFALLINNYREEKMNNIFIGNWNPFDIKNKRDFINEIKKSDFHFQGDFITLNLLTKVLKTDFLILTENSPSLIEVSNEFNLNNRIILLYYSIFNENSDFQAIGLKYNETPKRSKIETIFTRDSLPLEIKRLTDIDEMFLYHVQNICSNTECNKDNIHSIIDKIEKELGKSIPSDKRCNLIKILFTWINNHNYLKLVKSD